MTLEGANNFGENNNGTIYTLNSLQTGQYCVVLPKNMDNNVNMLVDLNWKSNFDSLANNTMTKEDLVKSIEEEYDAIVNTYASGVLVFPMLNLSELEEYINNNDKQKMFDETKKIGSITSELYQKLSNGGVDKSKIDQKIIIVEKTETDNKFVTWLKEQMPNFVDGVSFDELKSKISSTDNVNPFTGEASDETKVEPVNDIFGAPAEAAPSVEPVIPAPVVEPVEDPVPEVPTVDTSADTEPVKEEETAVPSTEPESNPKPEVSTETSAETSTETSTEDFEPKPVEDTKLETTQAIPEVVPQETSVAAQPVSDEPAKEAVQEEVHELDKKSGGFANLLILLVILIVVTVVSIELGKFLYHTIGS